MEAINGVKYHPVPAVRSSKIKQANGMQKLYTKIINKIEDFPPKLHPKPVPCNLIRNSPINKPVTKVRKTTENPIIKPVPTSGYESLVSSILSDDDEFYSKLTFDDSEQSLEDEIFEELEKVAHDEAKLNAALQNFDKILSEYNGKKAKELKQTEVVIKKEEKPSAIPKPLQKSKTCSIIESKCILKKQNEEKKKNIPQKVEKPLNVESLVPIASANCYQVTKSLWNLQDFDDFAKSAKSSEKPQLAVRRSDGPSTSARSTMSRAKSVWDMTPTAPLSLRPTYSRQSSISRIPIKSSKLSMSMMHLNVSNTALNTSYCSPSPRMTKSSVYASTTSLSNPTSSKLSLTRRSSLALAPKRQETPPPKYVETKTSLQRRYLTSSMNNINKMPLSIAPSKPIQISTTLKSAKSEMSLNNGRFVLKAFDRQQQSKQKVDPIHHSRMALKTKNVVGESMFDKCMNVKGQELARKVEEVSELNYVNERTKTIVVIGDGKKRDYIAKHQQASSAFPSPSTKALSVVSMNTKSSLTNSAYSIRNHHNDANKTLLKVNAITNPCTVDNQTGNRQQRQQTESENTSKSVTQSSNRTTVTTKIVTVKSPYNIRNNLSQSPTLKSCEIIPVVLDETTPVDVKDYNSDCSDDSGHISNENEDLTLKMELKKPRKISEELLGIFEQKSQQNILPAKAKVIELNHVNLIKSSLEIYPTLNKTCKSEVKIFIGQY
ncbi:CLUMA_CG015440, isoform A [Clunio marinus]|uniref:CLUMA_CG015440, isoform A n=1 Tax=Clunio marinus TaxID=568069 RepID=A0A1J1INP4_9DIPT|nr:CLUMA_CG015440, isoform A [Clunio marinus]